MTTTLKAARKYLQECGATVHDSFELTIGVQTYEAVRYTQRRPTQPGCPAYARGERESTVEALFVLGELPSSYKRNPGGMYTNGLQYRLDEAEIAGNWYVAGYSTTASRQRAASEGRFSAANFLLMLATSPPIGPQKYRNAKARKL